MLICAAGTLVAGIGCAFTPWFELFVVLRFLVAALSHGSYLIAFTFGK